MSFLAEIKARTAPKLVTDAVLQLKSLVGKRKGNLLIVVPFLSKAIVEILEREGVSGLDLNGNYLVQTPEMSAIRLDRENEFTESQAIKKIFSGNSSLVGRLFLSAKRRYQSVGAVCAAIQERGGSLSLSAVSKVLTGLENELIIEKGEAGISLLQPEKLLQRLEDGYRSPKVTAIMKVKLPPPWATLLPPEWDSAARTINESLPSAASWAMSGESSASRYTLTTPAATPAIFITDFGALTQFEEDRFNNAILNRTQDSFPYFGARALHDLRWSSPVQCYLELSRLDKRERELAETVRASILEGLK